MKTLKIRNCIAYGVGDLYGGGSFFIISTFAMYYLIAIVGMNPLLAGLIPGLGKIWDSISDPLMGYISDKTKSRFGRRRVFFLIAIFPIAITFTLIWIPVNFSSQLSLFLYYFIAYLLFYTTSTLAMVPYTALSAEMTTSFKERNKLTGFRMFFSMFATLLAGVLGQPIISTFDNPKTGHLVLGIVFGLFFAIPWIFLFLGTWEMPVVVDKKSTKVNFMSNFISIFNNKSFRVHLLMYICSYGAMDIMMVWLKFYVVDFLNLKSFMAIGLGSILLTQIIVLPIYIKISNIKGHAFSYRIGLSLWFTGLLLFSLQSSSSPLLLLILNCVLIGAGLGAGVITPFQLLPFVTDVDELITEEKRAGTYAGSMTLIRKLIQGAVVLPLTGALLCIIGYLGPIPESFTQSQFETEIIDEIDNKIDSSFLESIYLVSNGIYYLQENISDENSRRTRQILDKIDYKGGGANNIKIDVIQSVVTLKWMKILFILCPIFFIIIGIVSSLKFKITPENHNILIKEIKRIKDGGSRIDAEFNTKCVCELLTGKKY